MPWINPSTRAAGYKVTAGTWNQDVVANTEFLAKPPSVRVRRAAAQSIPDNTYTALSFDTEDWDSDLMWSSTAPTKVFARTAGKYLVAAIGHFAASTGGTVRFVGIRKNSTGTGGPTDGVVNHRDSPSASFTVACGLTQMVSLSSGQFVEAVVYQDHSTNINTSTGQGGSYVSMIWMSS